MSLASEYDTFATEFRAAEKDHDKYSTKLAELNKSQASCLKTVTHLKRSIARLNELIAKGQKSASTPQELQTLEKYRRDVADAKLKLKDMADELPVSNNGAYLSLILGSNLNLSLLSKDARYKYKQDYESFKYSVTFVVLCVLVLSYFVPLRVIDSSCNFLMVWYYCTLTIREGILVINGSKIKGWWVLHHYLSTVFSGIVLTWKEGECYRAFRPQFIAFGIYICLVQLLQNQYQSGTLRRLHSLGQGHQMDVTVEGFTGWQFKGLTFLLPFLIGGYVFQLYNAFTLWNFSYECSGQWQVFALALLFGFIACGNLITTSMVLFRKFRDSDQYHSIVRKYRARKNTE